MLSDSYLKLPFPKNVYNELLTESFTMTEIRTTSTTGGEKGVKPQAYHLIPPVAITELARMFAAGTRSKYRPRNWERKYSWSNSFAALQRHVNLFWAGESIDIEMQMNHMSSVAWHATVLTTFYYNGPEFDDRPTVEHSFNGTPTVVNIETIYPAEHVDDWEPRRGENIAPRFDLIPPMPMAKLAELYGSGIVKPLGTEGRLWSDAYARLQEHAFKFWGGEDFDESGHHNLIFVLHYAFMLLDLYARFPEYDDRFTVDLGAVPIGFDSAPKKG